MPPEPLKGDRALFSSIAHALAEVAADHGCTVYVSSNTLSITIDRERSGRGEYDVHVKVRGDGA